jgi:hypothetical protein
MSVGGQGHGHGNGWEFAKVLGMIAVCVGLYKSYVTLQEINKRQEEQRILDWQHPEVFRLLANAGRKGIEFDKLRDQYWNTASYQNLPLDKRDEVELRRILISLIAKNAVTALGNDRFRIRSESDLCGAQNSAADILNNLGPKALAYIDRYNGQATSPQWVESFRKEYKLEPGEAQMLLAGLIGARYIGVHKTTGTVWDVVTHPEVQHEVEIVPVMYYSPCSGVRHATAEELRPQPVPEPGRYQRSTERPMPPPSEAYPQVLPQQNQRAPINRSTPPPRM